MKSIPKKTVYMDDTVETLDGFDVVVTDDNRLAIANEGSNRLTIVATTADIGHPSPLHDDLAEAYRDAV